MIGLFGLLHKKMSHRPSLSSLQASIDHLSRSDQQQLYDWLGKRLQENTPTVVSPIAIETRNYEGKTYVRQKRRCGKLACPCMDGEIQEVGHGPYWYAYWNEAGKTQNKYVGKRPPWQTKETPTQHQRLSAELVDG
jgi:hypothetical protein